MQTQSVAILPELLSSKSHSLPRKVAVILTGVFSLTLLAQIKIHLGYTLVPITGQTFGITLLSLLFGRRLASATVLAYLLLGFIGLPIFSGLSAGILIAPTTGYLVGMLASSWIIGGLADRGATRSFSRAVGSASLGSVMIYTLGVIGLSFFIPKESLFISGVIPFLPGDIIKTLLAASIAVTVHRKALPKPSRTLLLLCLTLSSALISSSNTQAAEVAFLRLKSPDGNFIQLEPGGKFSHVAIRYQGEWLQSLPWSGVVLLPHLPAGEDAVILSNPDIPDPTPQEVLPFVGKLYDPFYSWTDDGVYCSELVGKLLGITPRPMHFDGSFWANRPDLPRGELGLSPDEIYEELKKSTGWREFTLCDLLLKKKTF